MTTTTQRSSGRGLAISSGMVVLRVLLAAAAGTGVADVGERLRAISHQLLSELSAHGFGLYSDQKDKLGVRLVCCMPLASSRKVRLASLANQQPAASTVQRLHRRIDYRPRRRVKPLRRTAQIESGSTLIIALHNSLLQPCAHSSSFWRCKRHFSPPRAALSYKHKPVQRSAATFARGGSINAATRDELIGEATGTAILLTFGYGMIATSAIDGALTLPGVAAVWGLGVALGVLASNDLSRSAPQSGGHSCISCDPKVPREEGRPLRRGAARGRHGCVCLDCNVTRGLALSSHRRRGSWASRA